MMHWFHVIWSRLSSALRNKRLDREFDEELTTHLELLTGEYQRAGLSHDEARREALLKLGRPSSLRETHREQRGIPLLDVLAQDLRYALRTLTKNPGFTSIAILSLALGIGANTALFSFVDALLLRSLPVRDPDRLVHVQQQVRLAVGTKVGSSFPKPLADSIRGHHQVFSEVVGFNDLDRPVIAIDGAMEPSRQVQQVSGNFFRDLDVTMVLGRPPEDADNAVAIISYGMWRSRFDGSPGVLSRSLTVEGQVYSIIGVAAPRFLGVSLENPVDLWILPSRSSPKPNPQWTSSSVNS